MSELAVRDSLPDQSLVSLLAAVDSFVQGRPDVTRLAVISLMARGHLLVQDVPGVGKTSLAIALARSAGVSWSRIQFTPDLLPSDVTGASIYDPASGGLRFHPGPIFGSVVLADEVNRASPRTQAALLEAMQEGAVTIDGTSHPLPELFMVIATQNPIEMAGTYPLPEAQLDRFMMRLAMGYPSAEAEARVVRAQAEGHTPQGISPAMSHESFSNAVRQVERVNIDDSLIDYIVRLVETTRAHAEVELGVSPRGSVAMMRASRSSAALNGRDYVVPGDIQSLAIPVFAHRIILNPRAAAQGTTAERLVAQIVESVPAPQP